MHIWHNGKLKQADDGVFTAADRIRLGDGIFDTMLAVDGRAQRAGLHYARLMRDAGIFGIPLEKDLTLEKFHDAAEALLRKNGALAGKCAINTVISRGPGKDGLSLPDIPAVQIVMRMRALPDSFPPVKAIISETVRRNEGSPLSRCKSLNYGDNILALKEAQQKGGNEAFLLNNRERVCCATIGNIFIVKNGALYTPPVEDGALPGIARGLLTEKYGAKERSLTRDDLETAEGIYITNSIRGAAAVKSLDKNTLSVPAVEIPHGFHLE